MLDSLQQMHLKLEVHAQFTETATNANDKQIPKERYINY